MKKVIKIGAILLVVLVLLVVAAAVAVPSLVNRFKPQIAEQVFKQTGMRLELAGDIGLTLYPFVGVVLDDVALSEAPDRSFLALQSVKVSVALLPLFGGKLEVDQVLVDGLALNLQVDAAGRGNWQIILDTQAAGKTAPDQPASQEPGADLAIQVARLAVTNARLSFQDAASGQHIELANLQLTVDDFTLGENFPLQLGLAVTTAEPALALTLDTQATLNIQPDFQRIGVPDLQLVLTARGAPLGEQEARLTVTAQSSIDLAQQTVAVPRLAINLNNLALEGQATLTGFEQPVIQGRIKVPAMSPRDLLASLGLPAIATQDPAVLSAFSLQTELSASPAQVSLAGLQISVDDTRLNADLTLEPQPLAVRGTLQIDRLDLRRYLPPVADPAAQSAAAAVSPQTSTGAAPQPAGAATPAEQPAEHPFAVLKTLALDLRLGLDELLLPANRVEQLRLHLTGKDGVIVLKDSGATLDGEPATLALTLDARHTDPAQLGIKAAVSARLPEVAVQAELDSQLRADASFTTLALQPLRVNALASGKALNGKQARVKLESTLTAALAEQWVQITQTRLGVNTLQAEAALTVRDFAKPALSGRLNVAEFSARQWLDSLGVALPPMADSRALSKVGLTAQLAGPANQLGIQDLKIRLDDTRFTGNAALDLATQAISLNLQGDQINLDRYLPPPEPEGKAAPAASKESTAKADADKTVPAADDAIPLDALRALNAQLQFQLGRLTVKEYQTENMAIEVQAQQGLIELRKADASLYDGQLVTRARLDARGAQAQYEFSSKLVNVDTSKFPPALARQEFLGGLITVQPQGRVNIDTRYNSVGNRVQEVLDNATANLALSLEGGALEELKLLTDLYRLASLFREDVQDTSQFVARTGFRDLATQFSLKGMQLSHDKYSLNLNQDATVAGSGKVDLRGKTLEYRFDLSATEQFARKQKAWAQALLGVPIGYVCRAEFADSPAVSCQRDTKAVEKLAKSYAEQRLKQEANRQVERLLDKHLPAGGQADDKSASDPADKSSKDALKDAGRDLIRGLLK